MSSDTPILRVDSVGKDYLVYARPIDRLKQMLFGRRRRYYEVFTALSDVSFELRRGESLGVLGRNGAGKSTLLQVIAGTLQPSSGRHHVGGRIAALLELGSGFNMEYTGRENVFLNGAILGISEAEMRARYDEIVAFSGIGSFIDQPVKTYSSGMFMRLAFAVATSVSPDLLIVDEALSVGDIRFQQRCVARIRELREQGVSILFVSHDLESVKRVCDQAIVLEAGRVIRAGDAPEVADWYLARMIGDGIAEHDELQAPPEHREGVQASSEFKWLRHGDGKAEIVHAELLDRHGANVRVARLDDTVTLRFDVRFACALTRWGFGFYLRDRLGTDVIGVNTYQERTPLPAVVPGDVVRLEFTLDLRIRPGAYGVSPSISYSQEDLAFLDWINNVIVFELVDPTPKHIVFGIVHPQVTTRIATLDPTATDADDGVTADGATHPNKR